MTCSVGSPVKQASHGRHTTASIDAKHCLNSKLKSSTNFDWRKEKTQISCYFLPPPRFFSGQFFCFLREKLNGSKCCSSIFFVVRFFLHRSRSLSATNINTTTCVCLTWVSRLQVCLSCKKAFFWKLKFLVRGDRAQTTFVVLSVSAALPSWILQITAHSSPGFESRLCQHFFS